VIAINLVIPPGGKEKCFYWICAGINWQEVKALNNLVIDKTPEVILKRTSDYWQLWVNKESLNSELLPDKVFWHYKRSLLILRT
jgi:glucoamylase